MTEETKQSGQRSIPLREPKASLLLVDDTPANLVTLRAILDDPDYDLVEVASGEEALERLKSDEFAVILLDMHMPGLNGFETAKVFRADRQSRHTPIIFLTAADIDREQIEAGYALGAVDFFVKWQWHMWTRQRWNWLTIFTAASRPIPPLPAACGTSFAPARQRSSR